jgi:hypothetical protein
VSYGFRPEDISVLLPETSVTKEPGIPADLLARQSKQNSDTAAALHTQKAKLELLIQCRSLPR